MPPSYPSPIHPVRHRQRPAPHSHSHRNSPSSRSKDSAFVLPGKRGKVTRLILASIILFPPVTILLLAMLPLILVTTVLFTYSVAWFLYWSMAGPLTLSMLPFDPRRVWKLNRAVFGVLISNVSLIPIGLSLIRYRFWTMRGSPDHLTDVEYNPERPNNKLDIYIPQDHIQTAEYNSRRNISEKQGEKRVLRPVIVFIYGGGWYSGSKMIYTLVGARLRSMGYLVIIPEYSIYPHGECKEMERDVKMAIQWAYRHCMEYGGDPQKMYLMGHSAGAHLCALTVLNDSIQRTPISLYGSSPAAIATSPILTTMLGEEELDEEDVLPRLRGLILCSGVYNIPEHYIHESERAVEEISAMGRVMGNSEGTFRLHSPTIVLQELLQVSTRIDKNYPTESQTRHQNLLRHLRSLLPIETLVLHGNRDTTVPSKSSLDFYIELKTLQLGSSAKLCVIENMRHENPVVGKEDRRSVGLGAIGLAK
ncbi:Alpha/Beta hydrolase protein [Mortierella sp. GBAus27b]|nr:Alpha/Beta hydrolase protein [Mortierella sp. GBAus27b]